MENIIGVILNNENGISLNTKMSQQQVNNTMRSHYKRGWPSRPDYSYGYGPRYDKNIPYNQFVGQMNEYKNIKFLHLDRDVMELIDQNKIHDWIYSLKDLKVFVCSAKVPQQLIEDILKNNKLEYLTIMIDEKISDIIIKHCKNIHLILGWFNIESDPEQHYLNIIKETCPKSLQIYNIENIDNSIVTKNNDPGTDDPSDYTCRDTLIIDFENDVFLEKIYNINNELDVEFPSISLYGDDDDGSYFHYYNNNWRPHMFLKYNQ